jgi:hypothetical protein
MISSLILLGVLNGHHISDVFNHADDARVALRVSTDVAGWAVAYVETLLTVLNLLLQLQERVPEFPKFVRVLLKQMQHESESRALANPRKLGKLINGLLQNFRNQIHSCEDTSQKPPFTSP